MTIRYSRWLFTPAEGTFEFANDYLWRRIDEADNAAGCSGPSATKKVGSLR